jgi:hypothetical protein
MLDEKSSTVKPTIPVQPVITQPVYQQPILNQPVFQQAPSLQQPKKLEMDNEANGESLLDF